MRLENGDLACNEVEALDRWIRHFAYNEGGSRCQPQDLVDDQRRGLTCAGGEPFELQVGELPTRSDLERAMMRLTCGKAAGPDHLPAELLKFGSGIISRSLFPLFLKMVLRSDEAMQFKGGVLHPAWKGRSSPSDCASHRALLVSSTVGKTLYSVLRSTCADSMSRAASPLQVGGLPRFPVQFPAHLVRVFQSWRKTSSHAILFLDLREAFYRVCRPMLETAELSDEGLAQVFRQLSLPADTFQSFRDSLAKGSVLGQAQAPEWLQRVIGTVLRQTWFRLPQQPDVVHTTLISRPGDCLADVLFYFVFAAVLREVRERASKVGLLSSVAWCGAMANNLTPVPACASSESLPVHDVTWMDDLSLLLQFPDAASVLPGLSAVAGILVDCCLSRGLTPNLDKGKTEALVFLSGAGSRRVRVSCLSDACPTVPVLSAQWSAARLRVVSTYKHLGGILHHKGGLRDELRVRTGQAWQSYRKHWSKPFGQAHVCLKDKMMLFQTLVLPCLFYGAGTWTDFGDQDLRPVNRCYHDMCRSLLKRHFKGDVTRLHDDRVRALVRAPDVSSWIHFTRLSYLASFVRVEVREAWALVHAEGQWLALVRASLSWLFRLQGPHSDFADWPAAWEKWCELITCSPQAWKRLLRRALQRDLRLQVLAEGWQHCRGLFARCLMQAGAFLQHRCDISQSAGFFCGPCRRRFATKQQWAVHAFKRHGIVKMSRLVTAGTQCPQCLKQFSSSIALWNHLDYSFRCIDKLLRRGFSCDPEPGLGNKAADRGRHFLGYVKQGFGPFVRDDAAADSQHDVPLSHAVSLAVCDGLRHTLQLRGGCLTVPGLLDAHRQAYCAVCISRTQLDATAREWCRQLPQLSEDMTVRDAAVHSLVAGWIRDNWSIDWLLGSDSPEHCASQPIFRESIAVLASLDFGMDLDVESGLFASTGGFLLCSAGILPAWRRRARIGATALMWRPAYAAPLG